MTSKENAKKAIDILPAQFEVVGIMIMDVASDRGGVIPLSKEHFNTVLNTLVVNVAMGNDPMVRKFAAPKNPN
jgi:hypothetical protein